MKKVPLMLLALATLPILNTPLFAHDGQHYRIDQTFKVGGTGHWDYLAVYKNSLYVSHGDRVNILNKDTGNSTGTIDGTIGVHGIAFVPQLNKGYISDGQADNITVFDLSTHKTLSHIATGKDPDAIMYDVFSKKIMVCNGHSNSLSVIDPVTEKTIAIIQVGGKPETAVSDGNGKVYVNIEDKSEVVEITLSENKVTHHWPLKPASEPSGLAFEKNTQRLFVGCDKMLAVMSATNGKIIATLPIGAGCDGVVFDAKSKNIFASNGDGTLTVIKEITKDNFKVEEQLTTEKGARTIALDEATQTLYLPTADFGDPTIKNKRKSVLPGTFRILVVKPSR